ncbi:hypothetical protein [Labrys wisconsinensis]|uniref:Two-component sensor histidine kinase n=1 Tax=Labrys wisconsinensis TaxID=425677 RepID=A0ABU0JFH4_9HYPH|nr:hypothetical protein [Labrys wisconsinensis]MDQ0471872.1 hypothetical protein [Labrys wisconsinensis]
MLLRVVGSVAVVGTIAGLLVENRRLREELEERKRMLRIVGDAYQRGVMDAAPPRLQPASASFEAIADAGLSLGGPQGRV